MKWPPVNLNDFSQIRDEIKLKIPWFRCVDVEIAMVASLLALCALFVDRKKKLRRHARASAMALHTTACHRLKNEQQVVCIASLLEKVENKNLVSHFTITTATTVTTASTWTEMLSETLLLCIVSNRCWIYAQRTLEISWIHKSLHVKSISATMNVFKAAAAATTDCNVKNVLRIEWSKNDHL